MTTQHYKYQHTMQSPKVAALPVRTLDKADSVGHGDHWAIFGADDDKLKAWLVSSLERASVPEGLGSSKTCDEYLVVGANTPCHLKQVFVLQDGKPTALANVFPAVDSPYGLECVIDEVLLCADSQDAIVRLTSTDGTTIYAFDQLYAINACHYESGKRYYVNFSAWAYDVSPSDASQKIVVDDPNAIRYHRAFNDIVAKNNGQVPSDIESQIKQWQPISDEPLAPVEINLGHSCIYLFGETLGQEDEAWCQGQVLGKSTTEFFGQAMTLFDVVILREQDAKPFVVRMATPSSDKTEKIAVHDYIQANIWLQAAVFAKTQN